MKKLFENNPNFNVLDEPFYVELEEQKLAAKARLDVGRMTPCLEMFGMITVAEARVVKVLSRRVVGVPFEDTFPVVEALVARAKGWS